MKDPCTLGKYVYQCRHCGHKNRCKSAADQHAALKHPNVKPRIRKVWIDYY